MTWHALSNKQGIRVSGRLRFIEQHVRSAFHYIFCKTTVLSLGSVSQQERSHWLELDGYACTWYHHNKIMIKIARFNFE